MTYNQIIKRLKTICLAHRQVRTFKRGLQQDELSDDKQVLYPAVFLNETDGNISLTNNISSFCFRLKVLDLVHVSEATKENELDVLSDTASILLDLLAQINYPGYSDWKISVSNTMHIVIENDGDMNAGWYVDLCIGFPYTQNVCVVPSDLIPDIEPNEIDVKVYNHYYTATGEEGTTITTCGEDADLVSASPTICGKKILLITREYSPLYRVSNLPQSTEYTWDDSEIGLGLETMPGERFLILYRNY